VGLICSFERTNLDIMARQTPAPPINHRLLDTAIEQFGRKGLEAASTRAIAAAAKTAMSSITYHYGGKEGLYLAAAHRIAEQISKRFATTMAQAPNPDALDASAAVEQVVTLTDAFLSMMLSPESAPWARFIVREQMEPTEAFEVLWTQFMSRVSGHLVKLVLRAGNGRWKPAEARVRAVALVGQALVFRVSRATALRITGWEDIGAAQAAEIRRVLHAHIRLVLNPNADNVL
jgi:TetR/AcrR family transcriptional regulator, regulator of cefoperazone and chloramphenicol sensitivity